MVELEVVEAAPAVFCLEEGRRPGRHEDTFEWVDRTNFAQAGEMIRRVCLRTRQTNPSLAYRECVARRPRVVVRDEVVVTIGGVELSGEALPYVGVMPGFPGIYEIRLMVPETEEGDPEIRVRVREQASQEGIRLVTREKSAEPEPNELSGK